MVVSIFKDCSNANKIIKMSLYILKCMFKVGTYLNYTITT
jgi:hypothetical protein